MRKTKLTLSRETLRSLATHDGTLRGVVGGIATTPITQCAASICVLTCPVVCKTRSAQIACPP
jgi:hypothetical protein